MRLKGLFCLFCALILPSVVSASVIPITNFSFDSSDRSWVGQGESVFVTPEDGFLFTVSGATNHVRMRIASLNSPFGPDWNPGSGDPYNYWTLDLAAIGSEPLAIGFYDNAARYPFQNDDQPGLSLSGNHRGNNRNAGFFEIFEIGFDVNGGLMNLAVDFTQFGEENEDRWITGSFNYKTASVPEPATMLLFGIGLTGLIGFQQRKQKKS